MRRRALALAFCAALGLASTACGPAATTSQVVVRSGENVKPGAYVHIWRACAHVSRRCRDHDVGRGVVTAIIAGPPDLAIVVVESGTEVREGDRALEDGPMDYSASGRPSADVNRRPARAR